MAELFWLPNIKDADAPTLAEMQSGKRLNGAVMLLPNFVSDWGQDIVQLKMVYNYCTPIKFPTTPESVCFMTGLPR